MSKNLACEPYLVIDGIWISHKQSLPWVVLVGNRDPSENIM